MGACPDWYPYIRVAKVMGLGDPRRALTLPSWWIARILAAEAAESEAQEMIAKRQAAAKT